MGFPQEGRQAPEAVLRLQLRERHRTRRQGPRSMALRRQVTGHTTPRHEQPLPMTGRHRIRRLQRKLVLPEREQKMGEGPGRVTAFLGVKGRQHVGHGGARQCFVRSGDEPLQVGGVHPRADRGEARCLLRSCLQRPLARMAGHAIQLLNQHLPAQFWFKRPGHQARDDRFGPGPEHQHPPREQ